MMFPLLTANSPEGCCGFPTIVLQIVKAWALRAYVSMAAREPDAPLAVTDVKSKIYAGN